MSKRRREVSAGGVVHRRRGGRPEVVLASRRTRTSDLAWGLPKGHIDPGETLEEAALREVREETGFTCELEESLGKISYFYVWEGVRISKVVHFFLMRATGGDPSQRDQEMEDVHWFAMDEALSMASYASEREVLERAAAALA